MAKSVLKTRKEWFETLEDPYKTELIQNSSPLKLKQKVVSLEIAVIMAFVWGDSPQKHKYWENFYNSIFM